MKHFIPAALDIDELLKRHPPSQIKQFKKDSLIYIIHLLTSIQATNKDLDIINGFVPIYSPILQKKVKNYRDYLDYLLQYGVILTDNWYIKGVKSKGYKFTPRYTGKNKIINVVDRNLIKAVKAESRFKVSMTKKYNHLFKWYNEDLQIDYDLAMDFIGDDLARKLANPNLRDFDAKTKQYKDPIVQYNCSHLNIERIAYGDFALSVDDNVFRLHSTISNLRSELRNCISFGGRNLVSIDIKNSQPFISTSVLADWFWNDTYSLNKDSNINIQTISKSLSTIIFQGNNTTNSYIMLSKSAQIQADSDLERYKLLVQQGVFYEYLADSIGEELGIGYNDRKKVKAAVFQVLFTDNRFLGQAEAKPKQLFKKHFPTVYELFSRIKKSDKTNLPRLLQRIESHLMLLVVAKRIARERPRLPIFTIHDSIVTTEGDEEYVKSVLLDEMTKAIGFPPKLSTEVWQPSNLAFKDGTMFYGDMSLAI